MEAHFVVLLRDGKIIERGTYEQLVAMKGEIAQLIKTANNDESQDDSQLSQSDSRSDADTMYGADDPDSPEEVEEAQEGMTELAPIKASGRGPPLRKTSDLTLRRASTASFRGPRGKMTDEEENKVRHFVAVPKVCMLSCVKHELTGEQGALKSKQSKEGSEQGKVKWDVYMEYAKTSNLSAVAVYLAMLLGAQAAQIGESLIVISLYERQRMERIYSVTTNMPCCIGKGSCISFMTVR
jgi:hypothetical protein